MGSSMERGKRFGVPCLLHLKANWRIRVLRQATTFTATTNNEYTVWWCAFRFTREYNINRPENVNMLQIKKPLSDYNKTIAGLYY